VPSPLISFIADQAKLGAPGDEGVSARVSRALLAATMPNPGVERIVVTQGDDPLLILSSGIPPTITAHDAETGALRTEVSEPGLGFSLFFTP
jgi:hypothetical protein